MKVDRMFRQLYIHNGVSVSSSQFGSLALSTSTCEWKKKKMVRIPSDDSLQYCGRCFGSLLLCREELLKTVFVIAVVGSNIVVLAASGANLC